MDEKGKALKGGKRKFSIPGQFAPRLVEMLESPPMRVLSLSGHRLLDRLEIELGHHAGHDNGKLPVTFDQFVEHGIHRQAIPPAIREAVALGFVEITREGRAGNAEYRLPTLYRLTYRPTDLTEPTDDWRKIATMQEAESIATSARNASKKQKSRGGKRTMGQYGNRTSKALFHSTETNPTVIVRKPPLLSISREGNAAAGDTARQPAPKSGQATVATRRAAVLDLLSTSLLSVPVDSFGDEAFPPRRAVRQ